MKEKKKRSKRRWILWIILGIIGCSGISLIGCLAFLTYIAQGLGEFYGSNSGCGSEDVTPFEGYARVKIPEDYSNFLSTCGGLQGWWAEAHFDINPDDFHDFLASTSIDESTLTDQFPPTLYSVWKEEIRDIDNLLYGIYDSDEWLEEVIVDTSNPERWTVYFTVLAG